MTAEICDFSTHIIPTVTIMTEHKTQFFCNIASSIETCSFPAVSVLSCFVVDSSFRSHYEHKCACRPHCLLVSKTTTHLVSLRTKKWLIITAGQGSSGCKCLLTQIVLTLFINSFDTHLKWRSDFWVYSGLFAFSIWAIEQVHCAHNLLTVSLYIWDYIYIYNFFYFLRPL